ncbi:MAG: AMP-binding protein [Verrucomicrobia bacterium]|nr:AMP-binding protein [Verrucomicrobiota bacterium]
MKTIRELTSLSELPAELTDRFGDQAALASSRACGGGGFSYRQLSENARRGAAALHQAGLETGDRILLLADSTPAWAVALFSIFQAGMIAVPVPPPSPPALIGGIARRAKIRGCILSESQAGAIRDVEGIECRLSADRMFVSEDSVERTAAWKPSELAVLAFTSGSTAQPRAVELTHANLLADLAGLLDARQARRGDAFLSMLPPAHLFELMVGLLGPLSCGAKIVYPGSPLPNRLIDSLRDDGITYACCVPALLTCLYEEILDELVDRGTVAAERRGQTIRQTARRFESELKPDEVRRIHAGVRQRIGEGFHTLAVGGAAMDPDWLPILRGVGIRTEVGYGLTEASPIVSLGLAGECPVGSVGRPLPGVEVRIDSNEEILVRGANVMRGYHRDEMATLAVLADGWLRTGDRGRIDDRGFLFITGRLKEAMVTAAGETVYPDEIEPYYSSSAFAEWCVAPRRGVDGNDVPTLFVVPAAAEQSQERLTEVFRSLRSLAPARLRLNEMIRVPAPLPRTPTGKVQRRRVAEQWDHKL